MDITGFSTQPALGTTQPGDLYVDLQSRSLWLGVDTAVEENGSVLISDIMAMLANDQQTLLDAKTYVDAQILTRAPTVHTHSSSQVTDFIPAVQSIVNAMPSANFIKGMVMIYSGVLTNIGVGDLAGWALCDGRAAPTLPGGVTPNLVDRFIIGAGNLLPGNKNTAIDLDMAEAGDHSHVIGDTALTISQLPSHNHGVGSYVFTGTTNTTGAHTHTISPFDAYSGGGGDNDRWSPQGGSARATSSNGNHAHTVSGTITGSSGSIGSGATHTHTSTPAAAHKHQITPGQVRASISWFALAYIVKL